MEKFLSNESLHRGIFDVGIDHLNPTSISEVIEFLKIIFNRSFFADLEST